MGDVALIGLLDVMPKTLQGIIKGIKYNPLHVHLAQ